MALMVDSTSSAQPFPVQAGKQFGAPADQNAQPAPGAPADPQAQSAPTGDQTQFSPEGRRKADAPKTGAAQTDPKQAQVIAELAQIDREVRAHEQAHVAAGGSLVRGAASFGYRSGPDGRLYAVSGEVSIDMSPVDGDPRATISKMDQVRKAAMAPAQPSGQDRAVASAAGNTQVNAQRELSQQQLQGTQGAQETPKSQEAPAPDRSAPQETPKPQGAPAPGSSGAQNRHPAQPTGESQPAKAAGPQTSYFAAGRAYNSSAAEHGLAKPSGHTPINRWA